MYVVCLCVTLFQNVEWTFDTQQITNLGFAVDQLKVRDCVSAPI